MREVSNGRGICKEAADTNVHDDIFCACINRSSDVSGEASDKDISRLTFVICATSDDGTGPVSCIDGNVWSVVSKNMKFWLSGDEIVGVTDGVNSDSEEIANAVFVKNELLTVLASPLTVADSSSPGVLDTVSDTLDKCDDVAVVE